MYIWKDSKYGKNEYKIYVLRYPIRNHYINLLLRTLYINIKLHLISLHQLSTSNLKYSVY